MASGYLGRIVPAIAVVMMGCATTSGNSKSDPDRYVSVASMTISPPSLMVATKSPRTAFIVLDPAKVPDEVTILVDGVDRGGRLTGVHSFVERDLKRVFANYFTDVKIVPPTQALPAVPHAIVDVKIDRVEVLVEGRRRNGIMEVASGSAAITWGLGLRMSESNDYLYSYAGESASVSSEEPGLVFRSMFEAAIGSMLKGYTDKSVHKKVLELPAPPPGSTISL